MAAKKKTAKAKKKKSPAKKPAAKAKKNAKAPATKMASGQPNWHGLSTGNDQAAADFYGKVLGLKSQRVSMGSESMIMLSAGGEQIAHIDSLGPGEKPRWIVYFNTADVDKAAKLCEQNGGKIVMGPADIPPGRIVFLVDPAGAEFALFKPRS